MPYDVFISYAHEDLPHANMLDAELRRAGKSVWLDTRDIAGGVDIGERVRVGVSNCTFLCAIVTPHYRESWWTGMEHEAMARREGALSPTRILPCLFRDEPPPWLANRAFLDFRSGFTNGFTRLLHSMNAVLAETRKRSGIAVALGLGATALGGFAALTRIPVEAATKLLMHADHHKLALCLQQAGKPVPTKKADRARAWAQHSGSDLDILGEALTVEVLRRAARERRLATSGTKRELMKALLKKL